MKYIWLTLLVAGLAVAVTAEEEVSDDLQKIEGRGQERTIALPTVAKPDPTQIVNDINTAAAAFVANPSEQVLLKIGNVLAALSGTTGTLNSLDPFAALKPGGTNTAGTVGAGVGTGLGIGAAALGAGVMALSAFKTALLNLASKGLQIANFVLAIIGLALLGVYLVQSEGDITGLTGRLYDTEFDTYNQYARSARSMMESPLVQRLSDLVLDSITKYD